MQQKVYDRETTALATDIQYLNEWPKEPTASFCASVCPPAVGGFLCLLSLDRLHLHNQPPLLILLVAQFTIAHLGPVLGACPEMTTAVGPPPPVFNAGQPADTPTANLWENFPGKQHILDPLQLCI